MAVRAGRSTPPRRMAKSRTGRSRSSAAPSASRTRSRRRRRRYADQLQYLPPLRPRDQGRRRHQPRQADRQEKGCRACHVINGRGGHHRPRPHAGRRKAPEQYSFSRLSGQRTAFAWHVAHLKDPRTLSLGHRDAQLPPFDRAGAGARHAGPVVAADVGAGGRTVPGAPAATRRHADEQQAEQADADGPGRLVREDRLLRLPLESRSSA